MPNHRPFHREFHLQPGGPLGCLLYALGLIGMGVLAGYILLPLIGIALALILGAALGVVVLALAAWAYWRIRLWWRRVRGRRQGPGPTYGLHILDDDEVAGADRRDAAPPPPPRHRLNVEVRRRPHEP